MSDATDVMARLRAEPADAIRTGDFTRAAALVESLWQELPMDQVSVPNAYWIIEYAVEIQMKLENFYAAWEWAQLGLKFAEKRHDLGEAEFLLGKVALERGDVESARELLKTASRKSNGKILNGEDPRYRALVRGTGV